jgi:hypothetical protein
MPVSDGFTETHFWGETVFAVRRIPERKIANNKNVAPFVRFEKMMDT